MKSVLAARAHAVMGWFGFRLAIALLMSVGYCDLASAVNPGGGCTAFNSPGTTILVTPSSSTYPGGATITAQAEMATPSQCAVTSSLKLYINGSAVASSTTYAISNYALSNLSAGTYSIYSSVMYSNGTSATSTTKTLTIAPAAQTISMSTIPTQTYLGTAAGISATSTSGLAVTNFASASPAVCSVSGSSVSTLATGTCTVTANLAASANYTAALQASTLFAVAPATPTIAIAPIPTQTYGTASVTISATSTSGLPVTSFATTSVPTICTVSGSTVSITGAGSCVIVANQVASTNYTAAPQATTSFTIQPESQTIAFAALPAYNLGAAPFAISATTSSGQPVSFTSGTPTTCTVSGSIAAGWTVTAIGPGTTATSFACTINANQAGTTNYTAATQVSNTFTVNVLPATITSIAPATGTSYPSSATIPLAVTATAGSYPIASVSYYNGTTLLGKATNAPWTYSASNLAVGSYAISAVVTASNGATVTSATTSTVTVLAAPTITMTSPAFGASFAASASIPFTVTATAGAYTLSSVSYYTNSGVYGAPVLLATVSSAPWSYTDTAGLLSGSYSVYAVVSTTTTGVTAQSSVIYLTIGDGTGLPVSAAGVQAVNITAPSLNNPIAGTLPGSLGASVNGTATYNMPLVLPPGVGGMSPNLALNYSSQNSNGFLGLGWTLSGLSAIHRCNKTIAQDNVTGGVNFTNTDRLCLDGQRLILLAAGTGATGNPDVDYWTVGATYSTEVANFSRITSYTGAKGLAFKVESKTGRILYYGDQGDGTSFINAQGNNNAQAVVWALGQVQDLSGNYYTISYSNNTTTGEYLPTQMQYGGNNQTSLAPHLSVVFNYVTTRADNTIRYIAGSHNDMVSLINNIKVYNGLFSSGTATEVREFDISYTTSASSGRSQILSVQMQALNPQTNALVAFPSTNFNWGQGQPPQFTQATVGAVSGPVAPWNASNNTVLYNNIVWADFNGDGMTDAMVVDTSKSPVQYNIYLAKAGGGFAAPIVWTVPTSIATVIAQRQTAEIATGYSFHYAAVLNTATSNPGLSGWGLVGDFNGDGSSDLYLFGGYVCMSQLKTNPTAANAFSCTDSGTNTAAQNGTGASLVSWNAEDYMVFNTTGSGLSDILVRNGQYTDGTRCVSSIANGTQSFTCGVFAGTNDVISGTPGISTAPPSVNNQIGSFSGSGHLDVYRNNVQSGTGTSVMEVCVTGATGFTCSSWANVPTTPTIGTSGVGGLATMVGVSTVTDANGDGLTDVLLTGSQPGSGSGSEAAICYSTGFSFDCHNLASTLSADAVIQHIGSIDSDGSIKTLAFEYNTAGTSGIWRSCTIQNNTTLNCQTVTGGPTLPSLATLPVDGLPNPIVQFGGYLNDGTLNMLAYNQTIDATASGSEVNNFTSAGTAWTPFTLAPNSNLAVDKLTSVTNGIGRTSSVTYTQAGQASVYAQYATTGSAPVLPTYPNRAVSNPGYLVSAFNDSNGQNGSVESTYQYVGLNVDQSGRGSLGFASIVSTNQSSGISVATVYNQAWPLTGTVASSQTIATLNNNTVISTSSNTYALVALPDAYYSGNVTVGGTETSACVICFPYASAGTVTKADLNGNDLGTSTFSGITFDSFGNSLTSTVSSKLATDSTSFVTATTNTWDNDTGTCVASHGATYVIGRVCSTSVSKTNQAGTTLTRSSANTYFATGLTLTETLEPTHTTLPSDDLQVTNTYTRDGYGNVKTKVQSWLDPAIATVLSRTTSASYTPDGRFVLSSTNALGATENYVTDPVTGVRTQLTDINGLITTWTNDGLGRILSQTSPGGNVTQTVTNQCMSDCPTNATTVMITTHMNGSNQTTVPSLTYADPLGHVIRTMSYGFIGTPIITDHTFDVQSRPLASYQPVFASGATATYPSGVLASSQTLDNVNRPLTTVTLDTNGSFLTTAISYAGKTRTTINPATETRIETFDAIGELIGVQINAFKTAPQTNTYFAYDPFGNLVQTTDPANNHINVAYDVMGHKTQLNDPDLGIINYSVDPVGRTWKQVSPKEAAASQATTFQFDLLDRMISRLEPDLNSFFIYDVTAATGAPLTTAQITACQTAHSCGQLVESYTAPLSSGNVGMVNSSNTSKESDTIYNYDSLGRPSNNTLTLDASLNMVFYNETDYDAWSRPITKISQYGTDPLKEFDLRYNNYGYLNGVQRSGLTLWQPINQDASNRVTLERRDTGTGHVGLVTNRCFDANTGRLDETDASMVNGIVSCGSVPAVSVFQESYVYDVLGNVQQRNEAWNTGITGAVTTQSFSEGFTYDGLNRILTSAVTSTVSGTVVNQPQQSYSYSVDGNILTNTASGNYAYTGGTSGGPHAVKTVSGAATAFTYDVDGNQLTGNSRTNTWTSFDMPLSLSYTGSGGQFPTTSSQFTYGPNHERRTQSQGTSAIVYYGGVQEVLTDGSHNVTEIKTYWPMGLGVEIDRPAQVASELNWTHTDHLGSVVAITDIDGNLKEALGYDTWGNRRNAAGAPASIATTLNAEINENTDNKGYTGAEQITSLELVHLNGRVYDPLIGKFLSGDPMVADPKNGQNYNRYAYVLNNPMNSTDPSGFHQLNKGIWDEMGGAGGGNYDGEQGVDPGATIATDVTTTTTVTTTDASGYTTTTTVTQAPDGSFSMTIGTSSPASNGDGSNTTQTSATDTAAAAGATNNASPTLAAAVAALYPAAPSDISTTSFPSYYPVAQVGGTTLVSMGSTGGGTVAVAGQLGNYAYGTQGNPFAPSGAGLLNDIGAQNGVNYIGSAIGMSGSLLGGEVVGALGTAALSSLTLENLVTPAGAWTLMQTFANVEKTYFGAADIPSSLSSSAATSQGAILSNQIQAATRFAWYTNNTPAILWCPAGP